MALLCLIAAFPAAAIESDREQPLDYEANTLHSDQQKNLSVLTGNVRVTQGTIKGNGDKATVYQNTDSKITRVVMVGKPAHLEQKLDDGGMMRSNAATIDYHVDTDTVDMTGDVYVLQEGRGEFRAEHLVYNTKTGEMTSGNDQGDGRVHGRMLPKPKTEKPAAKPDDKKKPDDKR